MKSGIELIAEERKRQIEVEKYDSEHDSGYKNELYEAAACYFAAKRMRVLTEKEDYGVPNGWPWPEEFWKPSPDNRIKELKKAGALYQAHYDLHGHKNALDYVEICAKEIDEILNNQ